MFDVKKMIEEIAAKKEIKNVSFVGCGGSLACFFAPHYYVTHEAKTLTTLYENANEFTNDTPAFINENAIVVCASRRGNTPQTVEAAKKAKECGATVIGLQLETGTPLEEICDYIVQFKDTGADGALYEESKSSLALQIAYETVNVVEHNTETYEKMVAATKKMNDIIPAAVKACVPDAVKFSVDYANDDISTLWDQVQVTLELTNKQFVFSWKCNGSTHQQFTQMNSSMDHSKSLKKIQLT